MKAVEHRNEQELTSRLAALRSRPEFRGPVKPLNDHDATEHLALLYETRDQQVEAVALFIEQGLARGEQCLYIADENERTDVLDALEAAGIDVESALEDGSLRVCPRADLYEIEEGFDPDEAIEFYATLIEDGLTEYNAVRLTGEITLLEREDVAVEDIMEYEARVNELLHDRDCIALCQYNIDRVPDDVIRDVIKTHPHLIYDETINQNVYYTPPAQFLGRERTQTQEPDANQMLDTLLNLSDTVLDHQEQVELLYELYTIVAESERPYEVTLQELFECGCEHFDYTLGVIAHVDPDTNQFKIEETSSDHEYFQPGTLLPISEAYCTAAIDERGITGIQVAGTADEDVVVLREFGLQSHLGTYIQIGGDHNRVFFFVSSHPQETPVSGTEVTFHYLLGRWVKQEREAGHREPTLEAQSSAVKRRMQVTELAYEISHALVEEPTRAEIEQSVCDRLAASEIYEAAWISDRPVTEQRVTPDVWAGIDEDCLHSITDTSNSTEQSELLMQVVESRQPEVARVRDDSASDLSHRQLQDCGINSVMGIPIEHRETCHGILVVYAGQSDTFDEHHQTALTELGKIIGLAIAAVERKEALATTAVIELELQISDPNHWFSQLSAETDATFTLVGITLQSDGSAIVYATATGASAETIQTRATELDRVEHVRLIDEVEQDSRQETLFEFVLSYSAVVGTLAEHGATVTAVTAADGVTTSVVELPQTANIRDVVDAFQESFTDSKVIAKRTHDRSHQTEHGLRRELSDYLTEKQREALRTAYFAGYFDQPRNTTGGELADTLGVSPSTFHQHLQVGLRKLLTAAFDDQNTR